MNKYHHLAAAARQERKRRRMCEDKARFASEEAAVQKGLRSYHCPHCDGWHRSGKLAELVKTCQRVAVKRSNS